MGWFAAGEAMGSFMIPGAVFWIFLRVARDRQGSGARLAWTSVGWLLALFLIDANIVGDGRGFMAALNIGHVLAVALGIWLTVRAYKPRAPANA